MFRPTPNCHPFVLGLFLFVLGTTQVYGGWYKTKWGRTIEEIRAAVTEKVEEIEPAERNAYKTQYSFIIRNFPIDRYMFDVLLGFDKESRLAAVMLRLQKGQDYFACFLALETDLTRKYGVPGVANNDDEPLRGLLPGSILMKQTVRSREWVSDDSFVRLSYLHAESGGSTTVATNVQYQARGGETVDKL